MPEEQTQGTPDKDATRAQDDTVLDRLCRDRGPILAGASVGPGWFSIIERLDADLAVLLPDYTITQIKEKFGSLSYYIDFNADHDQALWRAVMDRIARAEAESAKTCEECGEPGFLWHTSWRRTLCELHGLEHYCRRSRLS